MAYYKVVKVRENGKLVSAIVYESEKMFRVYRDNRDSEPNIVPSAMCFDTIEAALDFANREPIFEIWVIEGECLGKPSRFLYLHEAEENEKALIEKIFNAEFDMFFPEGTVVLKNAKLVEREE